MFAFNGTICDKRFELKLFYLYAELICKRIYRHKTCIVTGVLILRAGVSEPYYEKFYCARRLRLTARRYLIENI